jgi:nicotinamidase-related amidase
VSDPVSPSLLLLCIDLQPVFLKAVADSPAFQRRCAFALKAAAGLGLDVLFTEQAPQKLGLTAPELHVLAPAAPALGKDAFSALGDERIRAAVLAEGREHVLLCGLETSVCVYQTALDLLAAGLQVTIFSDAVAARRPDDARTALDALIRAGAHVLPSETVFYALLRDVKHPFFRAYTQLVKAHA